MRTFKIQDKADFKRQLDDHCLRRDAMLYGSNRPGHYMVTLPGSYGGDIELFVSDLEVRAEPMGGPDWSDEAATWLDELFAAAAARNMAGSRSTAVHDCMLPKGQETRRIWEAIWRAIQDQAEGGVDLVDIREWLWDHRYEHPFREVDTLRKIIREGRAGCL